jgi:hypothetical protein
MVHGKDIWGLVSWIMIVRIDFLLISVASFLVLLGRDACTDAGLLVTRYLSGDFHLPLFIYHSSLEALRNFVYPSFITSVDRLWKEERYQRLLTHLHEQY